MANDAELLLESIAVIDAVIYEYALQVAREAFLKTDREMMEIVNKEREADDA